MVCSDISFGGQCDERIVGDQGYTVASYCPVTCMDECSLTTDPPIQAPVRPSPTASTVNTVSRTTSPTASPITDASATAPDEVDDQLLIPFLTYAIELIIPNPARNRRRAQQNGISISLDDDELERLTAERVHDALSALGSTYSSSDVDMNRVGEYVKFDFTVVAYSLTGLARFEGTDFDSLPSRSEVDAAILNAFEGDEYISSLHSSSDPVIASIAGATVQEMDESPSPPLPSENPEPKAQSQNGTNNIPVGVVVGVAVAVCALALVLAFGIYRSKKRKANSRNKPYASSSSPLSKQADPFDSPSRTKKISDDPFNDDGSDRSEGSSRFAGLVEKESTASTDGVEHADNFSRSRDIISLGDDRSHVAASMMGDASVTYSIDPSHVSGEDQSMASGSVGQMSALCDERSRNEACKDTEERDVEEDQALQYHRNSRPGSALSGYSGLSGVSELATIQDTSIDSKASPAWAKES